MDGGAQTMIFILSYAVFGASGAERPFPSVSFSSKLSTIYILTDVLSSGREILPKETSITVTATALWISLLFLRRARSRAGCSLWMFSPFFSCGLMLDFVFLLWGCAGRESSC